MMTTEWWLNVIWDVKMTWHYSLIIKKYMLVMENDILQDAKFTKFSKQCEKQVQTHLESNIILCCCVQAHFDQGKRLSPLQRYQSGTWREPLVLGGLTMITRPQKAKVSWRPHASAVQKIQAKKQNKRQKWQNTRASQLGQSFPKRFTKLDGVRRFREFSKTSAKRNSKASFHWSPVKRWYNMMSLPVDHVLSIMIFNTVLYSFSLIKTS